MQVEERPFIRDGLKTGDIITCDLRVGTVSIIRIKDSENISEGYIVLGWGRGDDKRYVSCIKDEIGFMDFAFAIAESHGCNIRKDHRSAEVLAVELVTMKKKTSQD